jgi:CelD/BcsL family acetyltransferase involved in cellulose biosynthesis
MNPPTSPGVPEVAAAPARFTVSRLESLEAMQAIADHWRGLERRSTAPFVWFQTFDWCQNWVLSHAGPRCRPLVFLLWDSGRLAGVWPLMRVQTAIGVTVLRNLGDPHTQYAGMLTESGGLTAAQAQALRTAFMATEGTDTALIGLLPEASPLNAVLPRRTAMAELRNEAAYLDLAAFGNAEAFLASRSKGQRRSRRRAMSHLSDRGPVELKVLRPGDPDFAPLLHRCIKFKNVWLTQTGRISAGLEYTEHAQFLAGLPRAPVGPDGPYLFAMMAGHSPVAIEIGFLRQGHYYSYIGGFDWSLRNLSPGKMQMEMTVCWLIANGVRSYDLLANPSGYKQDWSNRTLALVGHVVDFTPRGAAYSALWLRRLRPAIKRMFEAIPSDVRIGIGAIRQMPSWHFG